jgi:hypothetical protein
MKTKEIQAVIGAGLLIGMIIAGIALIQKSKNKSVTMTNKHD